MMKCPKCGGTFYKFDALNTITAHIHTPLGWEMLPGAYFQQDGYLCDTCGYIEFYARDAKTVIQNNARFFQNTETEAVLLKAVGERRRSMSARGRAETEKNQKANHDAVRRRNQRRKREAALLLNQSERNKKSD
jgi:predicted nucleic-acid-binding Zn-ribbon protein